VRRVLVACEFSGVVRDAFRRRGHDAWSCDLLPNDSPYHFQEDALEVIYAEPWDLAIFHPPCTRLTVAGARWFKGREQEQAEAIAFAEALWNAPIPRIALGRIGGSAGVSRWLVLPKQWPRSGAAISMFFQETLARPRRISMLQASLNGLDPHG
jgi:hypothetical protein